MLPVTVANRTFKPWHAHDHPFDCTLSLTAPTHSLSDPSPQLHAWLYIIVTSPNPHCSSDPSPQLHATQLTSYCCRQHLQTLAYPQLSASAARHFLSASSDWYPPEEKIQQHNNYTRWNGFSRYSQFSLLMIRTQKHTLVQWYGRVFWFNAQHSHGNY